MIWGFLKPGRLLKSIITKRKVQKTKPLASTPYLCDCKSVKHFIVQDEHQGWSMIRISAYVIEFWAFIIFISKQIHASVWAGCVPRWWHPNRQGGTSNVIQRDQEIGKRVALSRGLWDFIHKHTHLQHKHTCPLSSSLAYCLTPSGIPRILLSSFMRNNKLILLTHSTNCFLAYLRTAATQLISCELSAHYCSCYQVLLYFLRKSDISYKLPAFTEKVLADLCHIRVTQKTAFIVKQAHSCCGICLTHMLGTESWCT